jgi:hypothetical protein
MSSDHHEVLPAGRRRLSGLRQRGGAEVSPCAEAAKAAGLAIGWRHRLSAFCFLLALFVQVSPLHSQPAATNRVLDLDGKDACVELPAKLFTNQVITVEGWVKWREFGLYSRFFEFTDAPLWIGALNSGRSSELTIQSYPRLAFGDQTLDRAPLDCLEACQWRHVAVGGGAPTSRSCISTAR